MTDTRIAVCSWSLGTSDAIRLIERLREVGLEAVQIALSPLVRDPDAWSDSLARLPAAGVRIVSGMMALAGEDYSTLDSIRRTGGLRPDHTWDANRDHAAKIADIAADAGLDLVTFHAGFIPESPDDPERATLIERLRSVADLFGARGVRLGLETGQETAGTLLDALDELDRANVGVNFDPANMILYGMGDPVEALARLASRVVQVHVKDALPATTPGEWGTEVPVGRGDVDWNAFFAEARSIEPPVDFVIEREAGADRSSDIKAAAALIERFLDQPQRRMGHARTVEEERPCAGE